MLNNIVTILLKKKTCYQTRTARLKKTTHHRPVLETNTVKKIIAFLARLCRVRIEVT